MRYKVNNERGYTLILAVLIGALFSVFVVTLLTFTSSGISKNDVHEDNQQAMELSEKGIKHITQQIKQDVQEELDRHEDGLIKSDYIHLLGDVLDKYTCDNKIKGSGETGRYEVCVFDQLDKAKDILPQKVKFQSTGIIGSKTKEYITTTEIGAVQDPDYMQYAVNTFISEECAESRAVCHKGEGNLFLHGGVGIQGDINVERNLITSNRSYEKYSGHHWIHSYFPSSKEKSNGSLPKIIVGENIYTFQWDGVKGTRIDDFDYAEHVSLIDIPDEEPYKMRETIDENVFVGSYVPERSNRIDHPGRYDLDIEGEKEKYEYGPNDAGIKQIQTHLFGTGGVDRVIYNENYSNDKVFPKWYSQFGGTFKIRGKSTFKQFSTEGNLELGGVRSNNVIEFKEGAYVDGDLEIRNNTEVKGPIYVNGDLEINGKNITINSVLYVNGMVHIKHAEYDETIDSNIKGEHVIYSNGKIIMERTNRFNDFPAEINGFFYSKESIEMDGNESNIKLKGGISAPRIVLNSIRGRSYAGHLVGRQNDPQIVEGRSYDGWEDQAKRESRLQIVHDGNIAEEYSDLILENRIKEVLIKIIDKESM